MVVVVVADCMGAVGKGRAGMMSGVAIGGRVGEGGLVNRVWHLTM